MQKFANKVTYEDVLIEEWLSQRDEDQEISSQRQKNTYQESSNTYIQGKNIKEISQKLNRLQRNFLRDSQLKKEQKTNNTVSHCFFELDQIYKKAASILPGLKENHKEEGKQLATQIVSLYNCSVAQLSRRQKLQKQLAIRKNKHKFLLSEQESLEQQNTVVNKELQKTEAQHWLKMQVFKEN